MTKHDTAEQIAADIIAAQELAMDSGYKSARGCHSYSIGNEKSEAEHWFKRIIFYARSLAYEHADRMLERAARDIRPAEDATPEVASALLCAIGIIRSLKSSEVK